jgi:hypothetical protein
MERKCPVPYDQRPINEYHELRNSLDFIWTTENDTSFFKKTLSLLVFLIFVFSYIFIGSTNLNPIGYEPLLQILISSCLSFSIIILRFYLAWKYIYKRLMNSTVTYEESGWYDGQTWVKSTELVLKDRLVGTYELVPILQRLLQWILFSLSIVTFSSIWLLTYH